MVCLWSQRLNLLNDFTPGHSKKISSKIHSIFYGNTIKRTLKFQCRSRTIDTQQKGAAFHRQQPRLAKQRLAQQPLQ